MDIVVLEWPIGRIVVLEQRKIVILEWLLWNVVSLKGRSKPLSFKNNRLITFCIKLDEEVKNNNEFSKVLDLLLHPTLLLLLSIFCVMTHSFIIIQICSNSRY